MTRSHSYAKLPQRCQPMAMLASAALGVLLVLVAFAAPAFAAEGFGIEPGSLMAGTFTSEGAGGPLDESETPDRQAGDHPYQQTVRFALNTTTDTIGARVPVGADMRDSVIQLPPGFVGDPNSVPKCRQTVLDKLDYCPDDTVIGVARVSVVISSKTNQTYTVPVYNLVPNRGEVALMAFRTGSPLYFTVLIHVHVRDTSDYGLTATISNISQYGVALESAVTLWGVPADNSHDPYRGSATESSEGCLPETTEKSVGSCPSDAPPRPFLRNPVQCESAPTTTVSVDSWSNPAPRAADGSIDLSDMGDPAWQSVTATQPVLGGCGSLVFDPSIGVAPETSEVGSPSGYTVDLRVPQGDDPGGLATPDLRDAVVVLPAGVGVSAAAAGGLVGCTPEEVGLHSEDPVTCPDASKLGSVRVSSPDLPVNADGSEGALTGFLYLGAPASGVIGGPPFTGYLVAEGDGVSLRLAGRVVPDPVTGQLTATFMDNPPLPFDDVTLQFFGGPRAALVNPPDCGTFTTTSVLTPSSGGVAATPASAFSTSWDGQGAACPATLPFAPSFEAGATSTTAGGLTSFVLNIARSDGQQALSGITVSTPPGLLGSLSKVSLCGEPQASQGACPSSSQIGSATAGAGAGPEPFHVTGPVYLTGPYRGAPFGLSIVIPAVAGPFDLGDVVVRSAISVDPHDSHLVISSDALPQMVNTAQGQSGIPVDLQSVSVDIDKPGFMFNPTNCQPMAVSGTLSSNRGASEPVSSHFQVGGCAGLSFHPKFTVSTQAATSKALGASLDVKVTPGVGQANIAKTVVTLPRQLPARLTTIQQACPEATFAQNPASCPVGSAIGVATASTPVLTNPVAGPAYLVSHGGAAFPDVVVILQGEGVTVDLVGGVNIKNGITTATFNAVPDVPLSQFELKLPRGPHSGLAANLPAKAKGSMCAQRLVMPTTLTGQNGVAVKQSTKIAVTGCPKTKKKATSRGHTAKTRNAKTNRRPQ
jgi:hypothetical protein